MCLRRPFLRRWHQLFDYQVCQIGVVKIERATMRVCFTHFFTVSTCQNKYRKKTYI